MVPWLEWAYKELGSKIAEYAGFQANPRIIEYHAHTSLKATSDEVPWCSSFICAAFEESNIPSTRSAAAKSWLNWGSSISKPKEGCVVVLKRGTNPNQGHVALYVGETDTTIRCLGGNQKNAICILDYKKEDVLDYRWPADKNYSEKAEVKDCKDVH